MPSGCSYWRCVPEKALKWIVDNNIPLWPIRGPSSTLAYHPYKEILIAPLNIDIALLDVFASIGLAVTQPPQEVYDLAHTIKCHQLLTPELAHSTILVCFHDFCAAASSADKPFSNVEVESTHGH